MGRNPHVPDGGSDGDVLTLNTAIAGEVEWTTPSGGGGGAPTGAEYLVLTLSAGLSAERRLQLGTGLSGADGGANGDYTISLDSDLVALAGLSTTGIAVRTGPGTWTTRSLVQPAAGLTIADAGGVSGPPTFALADDLAALEGLATTGYAVRTATDNWVTRAITAGGGIVVTNGDAVAGATVIATTATQFVVTATGYTTVTLPEDTKFVSIACKNGGGGGGGGQTGDNSANRRGGGGGGSSGFGCGEWPRRVLPDSIEVYVGAGGAHGTPGAGSGTGLITLAEVTNTGFTGTATPQASSTLCYGGGRPTGGAQGSVSGNAGGAGTAPITSQAMWLRACSSSPQLLAGRAGSAGNASGSPGALSPFDSTTALHAGGCGGAGKASAGPTAAAGGAHDVFGHLAATTGGAAGGGAGSTPTGGPGTTADELAYTYGGTGGGSNTAGAGGNGGNGEKACGGGGGGAGTTTGGDGGDAGNGYCVITVV